ncbi:aldehyde dehydrogenase family protein, partial [Polymorphobacter sp.]|uniref:aldehyde dehydrogenase family protein n=1 Tax=Polymorphobacter sp. TaxID=1909290 RepID=UPI003F6E7EFC
MSADASRRTIEARNPRSGAVDCRFDAAGPADVTDAVAGLRAAQPAWAALPTSARAAALVRWAEAIEAGRLPIIEALAADTGRWLLSEREVDGAAKNLRRWARMAPEILGEHGGTEARASALIETVRYQNQFVPYPVAGFISPWNFPVTLSLIDAVPALAAGCAVIVKPSEVTSRFVAPLLATLAAVPELAGVVRFVLGDGATGAALIDAVDLICFTGSVPTGRKVAEAAARRFIPAFLELGGKDPVVVMASADIERATDAVLRGSVLNSGQVCLSIERVYVDRAIHDDFVARLVEKAKAVTLNVADIHDGDIGPMIFSRQADVVAAHLDDARVRGARIECGGALVQAGGVWCPPTVLTGVTHEMAIMREESFGPLLPVMAFDSLDEAVRLANDTSFGLSGSVIAGSIEEAMPVAYRINAGGVSVNDCGLTYMTYEPEKTSFGLSGLGGSRMGPA